MKTEVLILKLFFIPFLIFSQNQNTTHIDQNYREDQLYFGITYNTFLDPLADMTQKNFSPGINFGVIRDFPINATRQIALGLGLGYAFNFYSQNLKLSSISETAFQYEILPNDSFQNNRFSYQALEIPFEIRWRTSTAERYKFWRVYAGIKASYITTSNSFFESESEQINLKKIPLNPWVFGLTLSAGYNNWNAYVYYGLTPLFKQEAFNSSEINIKALQIGLMFYFL